MVDAVVTRVVDGKIPGNQQGGDGLQGFDHLREQWSDLERRWSAYLSSLAPEALDEIVYRKISSTGVRFGTRRSDVLFHVCTHAHYTSAQVINMLRQSGVEKLPDVMLISLARQERVTDDFMQDREQPPEQSREAMLE